MCLFFIRFRQIFGFCLLGESSIEYGMTYEIMSNFHSNLINNKDMNRFTVFNIQVNFWIFSHYGTMKLFLLCRMRTKICCNSTQGLFLWILWRLSWCIQLWYKYLRRIHFPKVATRSEIEGLFFPNNGLIYRDLSCGQLDLGLL